MTKFKEIPPLGSEVRLAGRVVRLSTAAYLQNEVRAESRPFWPWYQLCPMPNDVVTVDTRDGEKFLVEEAGAVVSRDRWICHVWQITSIQDGVLTLGQHFQWTILLPGASGSATSDECALDQVEIIGQVRQAYVMR